MMGQMTRVKRFLLVAMAPLLLVGLSGCKKSGTIDWVEWSPKSDGNRLGSCRVGVKNTVDEDGNEVGMDGKTRFTVRNVTYSACHKKYKEGEYVEWGKKSKK